MEENKELSYKILAIYPDGITRDHEFSYKPRMGERISIKDRNFIVIEAHESMVQVGQHSIFSTVGWDWVIELGR